MTPSARLPFFVACCLLLLGSICLPQSSLAQRKGRPTQPVSPLSDQILDAAIKTVELYPQDQRLAPPVHFLGSREPLVLEFDELRDPESRESDFFVDLQACDANWLPAISLPIEFYDGFTQDRIQEYQRSEFTKVGYVHYRYAFPEEGETFLKSGNYLLRVFRDGNPDAVVLTRRLVVVEPLVGVSLADELSQAPRRRRMERLSLLVNPGSLELFNPMNDLQVRLMPNGRFDQQMILSPHSLVNGQIRFEGSLLNWFPQGHEFRPLDIRSTRFWSAQIQEVEAREEVDDVFLFPDQAWEVNTFGRQPDLNGQFLIEVQEWQRPEVQADYVYACFALQREAQLPDREVFVSGKWLDWQHGAANRMRWNEELHRYELELLLKQGYYDFQYVTVPAAGGTAEAATFQGRLTDAENAYFVLVYFRGPMDRNDRVVGYWAVNG